MSCSTPHLASAMECWLLCHHPNSGEVPHVPTEPSLGQHPLPLIAVCPHHRATRSIPMSVAKELRELCAAVVNLWPLALIFSFFSFLFIV